MKPENPRDGVRVSLLLLAGLVFTGSIGAGFLQQFARIHSELKELRLESASLRQELEAREGTISALRHDLRRIEFATTFRAPGAGPSEDLSRNSGLEEHLQELWQAHSNTVVLLDRLMERSGLVPSPPPSEQSFQARIGQLQSSATEQEERIELAMQKIQTVYWNLAMPEELDQMDPKSGLTMATLANYWPYFEAKRELENLLRVGDALRLRLAHESIEANLSR
jgi:hypothetical protein